MTDPIPDNRNRLAHLLGYIFHPAILCVPTLALVLNHLPVVEAIGWTALVAAIVTLPGLVSITLLRRQQRYVHQRRNRHPVYVVLWLSVIACFVVVLLLDGPAALRVCLAALIVWLPAQFFVNAYYTKVSTHVAVAAGCCTGLLLLGRLDGLLLPAALVIIGLTAWARITTRNHTPAQVLLGVLVGAGSVLVVFPFLLG
jgi:hypothetical protein